MGMTTGHKCKLKQILYEILLTLWTSELITGNFPLLEDEHTVGVVDIRIQSCTEIDHKI
jgi:hypothetical protein